MLITTQISVIISLIKNMLCNKTLMIDRKTPAGKCESMEQPPSKWKPQRDSRGPWATAWTRHTHRKWPRAAFTVSAQVMQSHHAGVIRETPESNDSLTKSKRHTWHSTSDDAKCYQENKAGKRGGCTGGGGEVSVFNTVLRKASLGWNISAGPEKSDSKSQRRSERTLCVWTQQWPSEEMYSPGRLQKEA